MKKLTILWTLLIISMIAMWLIFTSSILGAKLLLYLLGAANILFAILIIKYSTRKLSTTACVINNPWCWVVILSICTRHSIFYNRGAINRET
jgi:hypothetical protein